MRDGNWNRSGCIGRYTFYVSLRELPIITGSDTPETRKKKIKKITDTAEQLTTVKYNENADLIGLLELFDNKISLTEIIQMPIPVLNDLREVKMKLNEERSKSVEDNTKKIIEARKKLETERRQKQRSIERKQELRRKK